MTAVRADTPQTVDPLSGLTARTVVGAATVLSLSVLIFSLARGAGEIVSISWAAVSIGCVIAAAVGLCVASAPFKAPFTGRAQVVITMLLMGAIASEAAASWGSNTVVLDGYGYLTAALFLFPLGSYRPWRDILLTTAALGLTQAVAAVMQAPFLVSTYPTPVFAVVTAAPIIASGVGAAALSRHLVRAEREEGIDQVAANRSGVARVEPLAIIDDEVAPLLERVTTSRATTAADIESAREIGSRLREVLVSESNATVLPSWVGGIHDPHRHLDRWSMRQRAAAAAYAARVIPPIAHPDATLRVNEDASWTFTVHRSDGLTPSRTALAPFIATLGVAFGGVSVDRSDTTITVQGRGSTVP